MSCRINFLYNSWALLFNLRTTYTERILGSYQWQKIGMIDFILKNIFQDDIAKESVNLGCTDWLVRHSHDSTGVRHTLRWSQACSGGQCECLRPGALVP